MVIIVVSISKANNTKMLKEQSQEFYNDVEELKDEIWRAHGKDRNR